MIREIIGAIVNVSVVPEYEQLEEQEIDIHLESGPTIEMYVPVETAQKLRNSIGSTVTFQISDVTMCGQHARATSFTFHNDA